jgi:hypothetical protein
MKPPILEPLEKLWLSKRSLVETVIEQFKHVSQIQHSRHRNDVNFMIKSSRRPRCLHSQTDKAANHHQHPRNMPLFRTEAVLLKPDRGCLYHTHSYVKGGSSISRADSCPRALRAFVDMIRLPATAGKTERRRTHVLISISPSHAPQLFLCPEVAENLGEKATSRPD